MAHQGKPKQNLSEKQFSKAFIPKKTIFFDPSQGFCLSGVNVSEKQIYIDFQPLSAIISLFKPKTWCLIHLRLRWWSLHAFTFRVRETTGGAGATRELRGRVRSQCWHEGILVGFTERFRVAPSALWSVDRSTRRSRFYTGATDLLNNLGVTIVVLGRSNRYLEQSNCFGSI